MGAKAQWETNRQRRRRASATEPAATAPKDVQASGDSSAFWDAKTRRETAEASISELREAELRGELVRRAMVEREVAGRLVALRDALETLADRVGPMVAAEADAHACRRLILSEVRNALAGFTRDRVEEAA